MGMSYNDLRLATIAINSFKLFLGNVMVVICRVQLGGSPASDIPMS